MSARPTELVFLESLDSTVSDAALLARAVRDPEAHATWLAHHCRVLSELLTILAFGRSIVVPSSYVWDSVAFLSAASVVLDAGDAVANPHIDKPFVVNLPDRGTLAAEIARRVGNTEYHSSAFPELGTLSALERQHIAHELRDRGAIELVADLPAQVADVADDIVVDRGALLMGVWEDLRHASRRVPWVTGPKLNDLLLAFPRYADELARLPQPEYGAGHVRMIGAALSRILAANPNLDSRSPFHEDPSAIWEASGQSLQQLSGGTEEAGIVREFIDTLYNVVVMRSTPARWGYFDVQVVGSSATGWAVAQDLAVAVGWRDTRSLATPTGGANQADSPTGFFVRAPEGGAALVQALKQSRAGLVAAVRTVMQLRGEPEFWRRVGDLAAAASGRIEGLDEAIQRHVGFVAKAIGRDIARIESANGLWTLRLTRAAVWIGSLTSAVLSFTGVVPWQISGPATVVGELGFMGAPMTQRLRQRSQSRYWSQNLSSTVYRMEPT